ncbi:hypothetical protein GJ744_002016 [Endocarpon pusillum]|uniref:Uncharacterized protein n=1 Tax=Endocarpon pusillum TaxID=364733 RepID=A0A8H7ABG2_9EURO|nr:hypothetical protein GJ744_002016 [Endocarpon pusillum]
MGQPHHDPYGFFQQDPVDLSNMRPFPRMELFFQMVLFLWVALSLWMKRLLL